jgi:hypothetical protein
VILPPLVFLGIPWLSHGDGGGGGGGGGGVVLQPKVDICPCPDVLVLHAGACTIKLFTAVIYGFS